METLDRWWHYKRELKKLRLQVITEDAIFRGTCEQLLSGLVPDTELVNLLEDVSEPGWKAPKLDRKLQLRLGDSHASCMQCMGEIDELVAKLQAQLHMHSKEAPKNLSLRQREKLKLTF